MAYDLAGKKVLVTGASSGIGAGLARAFAGAGATVGICARRADRLAEVLADCQRTSPDSRSWTIDLADLDATTAFALQVDDELGGIDLLVNNAGIPKRRHALDLTPDVVEQVMRVNYFSPVRLTLALLPRMIERGSGRILTVSSVAARLGPPREAAYSATKAAISAFMESLAVDLDGTDIRIHLVNPGIIDTELFHLPDNEPSLSDLEALPVEALTDAVLKQLDDDVFEIYVPDWFVDIVSGRYSNIGPFIEGSRQYVRERVKQIEAGG
jgi:NAD(P)-dependent dehydrogenase (short-subunit alcohol dehydrogenase family)